MGHPRDTSPAAEKRRAYRRKRYAENPNVRCFNCNLAKGLYGNAPISLEFV